MSRLFNLIALLVFSIGVGSLALTLYSWICDWPREAKGPSDLAEFSFENGPTQTHSSIHLFRSDPRPPQGSQPAGMGFSRGQNATSSPSLRAPPKKNSTGDT